MIFKFPQSLNLLLYKEIFFLFLFLGSRDFREQTHREHRVVRVEANLTEV
jgi:hypothetical protein